MKNQEKKEVDKIFLNTLQRLINYKNKLDERLMDHQFDVFQSMIIDLTGTEKLLFNTLFARIAFLGIQHKLHGPFIYELHLYRKEYNNLQTFKKYEDLYQLGLYLIGRLLADIYGAKISSDIKSAAYRPHFERFEIKFKDFKRSMRGMIAGFDTKRQSFNFIDETEPHKTIFLQTDKLELFQSDMAKLKEWEGEEKLPVTVELKDVGIASDDIIYPQWLVVEPDYLVDVTAIAE